MLSSLNGSYRPDDLKQISIHMEDGNDGVFSQGDFFLFYVKGPHRTEFDGNYFTHVNHLYSDSSFCFLLFDSTETPNYTDSASIPSTFTHEVSSYLDFQFIENDEFANITY